MEDAPDRSQDLDHDHEHDYDQEQEQDHEPADRPANPTSPAPGTSAPTPPLTAYVRALERYEGIRLLEIHQALGMTDAGTKPRAWPSLIAERLADLRASERLIAGLDLGPRLAASLFMLTETTSWSLNSLYHALGCLGVDPTTSVQRLLTLGVLALELAEGTTVTADLAQLIDRGATGGARFLAHPAVLGASRTVRPERRLPACEGSVSRIRETDGLEAILRLAAVWQRVDEGPLRRTQQGTLYKRDRDRLEDDPVLAGPIADALEPLPDMAAFWLALARGVGLLVDETEGDRVFAAAPEYWAENAIHLPQMIATRWLGLRSWHEQGGMQQDGSTVELALPPLRPVVLLWLATLGDDEWVAIDDFDAQLRELLPTWDRAGFLDEPSSAPAARAKGGRAKPARGAARASRSEGARPEPGVLESLLLGAAYQLGLVRAGVGSEGRSVVQLSPLGRYILALGPPPALRPAFDQFLYVQPNFEIIAYRQGLTPSLIGQFSRFARWSQVGAALELRLTPESVYRGLEGGLTPQEMLDRLSRHSQRALPAGVAESVRTWAGRRERVTYYSSATLVEFASRAELERALELWPESDRVPPVAISDRLLLVEDDSAIPFQRFRLSGSRDYRRSPEACLEVEPDGVTLSLDLSRSDLLVDAELIRFADELPFDPATGTPGNPRRRFAISPASIARGVNSGITPSALSHWFARRTGGPVPPAVQLLLLAGQSRVKPFATSRPLVLHVPTAELLDGLLQHPSTRGRLGERLGPTSVVVPDDELASFRTALGALGLALADPVAPDEPGTSLATPGAAAARRPKRP